ncbi:MAG: transporter substrate-binding domain-containing protein [Selenomonadaceae bacterium]|nr:transporter substrate-binding domain-containing protein [Selenomonadaceae bacterium]
MQKLLEHAGFLFALMALITALSTTGCGGEKSSAPESNKDKVTIGVITNLNASEIEYNEVMKKLEKSYRPSKANHSAEYKYFDKVNDMQMALEAGQIDMLSTYQNVAEYMIQRSDNKEILESERRLGDSFCFALREGDTGLQNELNKAIKAMISDGTLKKLVKEYITDLKSDEDPPAVPITHIDGAESIKVAVTGDLPPFDLVLPDGTPAGFSTAVLSEVSKRIGKNIELVNVVGNARASILTSKGADVVFWVAVPKDSTLLPANIDQPEGIAISEPYYHDLITHVGLKK